MKTALARAQKAIDQYRHDHPSWESSVTVPVPLGDLRALAEDAEILGWLAEMTEGIQKVYIEPVGWIQLDRKSIRKAMKEYEAESGGASCL